MATGFAARTPEYYRRPGGADEAENLRKLQAQVAGGQLSEELFQQFTGQTYPRPAPSPTPLDGRGTRVGEMPPDLRAPSPSPAPRASRRSKALRSMVQTTQCSR